MVTGTYRDLLAAVATSAGALTGLLFVALSVAPRRAEQWGPLVIVQIRTSAALMSFTSALAISLFSLVPGTGVGYPALVTGILGITFTAAAMRSILSSAASQRQKLQQFGLISLLMLIFGAELAGGIAVIVGAGGAEPAQVIGYALVTSLIVGIARAWELVGDRGTGLFASVAVLTGRAPRDPSD